MTELSTTQDTGNNNEGSGDGATKYGVKEQIALLSQVNLNEFDVRLREYVMDIRNVKPSIEAFSIDLTEFDAPFTHAENALVMFSTLDGAAIGKSLLWHFLAMHLFPSRT